MQVSEELVQFSMAFTISCCYGTTRRPPLITLSFSKFEQVLFEQNL